MWPKDISCYLRTPRANEISEYGTRWCINLCSPFWGSCLFDTFMFKTYWISYRDMIQVNILQIQRHVCVCVEQSKWAKQNRLFHHMQSTGVWLGCTAVQHTLPLKNIAHPTFPLMQLGTAFVSSHCVERKRESDIKVHSQRFTCSLRLTYFTFSMQLHTLTTCPHSPKYLKLYCTVCFLQRYLAKSTRFSLDPPQSASQTGYAW